MSTAPNRGARAASWGREGKSGMEEDAQNVSPRQKELL